MAWWRDFLKYETIISPNWDVEDTKKTNNIIFTPGLIEHPLYNWLAASPDGIVENSHLVEFKCYYTK